MSKENELTGKAYYSTKPSNIVREWEDKGNKLFLCETNEGKKWVIEHNFMEVPHTNNLFGKHISQFREIGKPYYIHLSDTFSEKGIFSEIGKHFPSHSEEIYREFLTSEMILRLAADYTNLYNSMLEDVIKRNAEISKLNKIIDVLKNKINSVKTLISNTIRFKKNDLNTVCDEINKIFPAKIEIEV